MMAPQQKDQSSMLALAVLIDANDATQGLRVLLSAPWYLNLGRYGVENWAQYYEVEPLAFEV